MVIKNKNDAYPDHAEFPCCVVDDFSDKVLILTVPESLRRNRVNLKNFINTIEEEYNPKNIIIVP